MIFIVVRLFFQLMDGIDMSVIITFNEGDGGIKYWVGYALMN